jgi:hypothetical protein
MLDQPVLELLFQGDALVTGLRKAVDGVHHEVEALQLVQHRHHIEGRRNGPLFLGKLAEKLPAGGTLRWAVPPEIGSSPKPSIRTNLPTGISCNSRYFNQG